MDKLKINYLCRSWQGFIQQLVYLVSRGYYYYCLIEYPLRKKEKWHQIDAKLIDKYKCNKSKFQRTRLKNKGNTNFYFIRYEHIALIMHTQGILPDDITMDDTFLDCRNKRARLNITIGSIDLWVMPPGDPNHQKVTVRIAKNSFRGIKDVLLNACRTQRKNIVVREYDKLNGLPAWSGIVRQKRMLADYVVREAGKHCIPLHKNDLRLNTFRKIHKVWQ